MNEPHYIVYVNGYDLLLTALDSLRPIADNVMIVDNRDFGSLEPYPSNDVTQYMFRPEFPLNQAQLLTLLTLRTQKMGCDWFTWSHHDSLSVSDTIVRLRDHARQLTGTNVPWGLIFTHDPGKPEHGPWNHVDTMCAVNVNAVLSVGGWDWYRFPDYFSDYDLYGKLRKAGFVMMQSGLPIEHMQGGSRTAAVDGNRALVKDRKWAAYNQLWQDRRAELGIDWPPQ